MRRGATPATRADDPWTRIVEQASRDFECAPARITPGPWLYDGVRIVEACGIEATYGFRPRDDGDFDVFLVLAFVATDTEHRGILPR